MSQRSALMLLAALGVLKAAGADGAFSQQVVRKSGAELGSRMFPINQRVKSQSLVMTVDDQGFWFSNFTIGASPSLEILLDTGSSDTILNPGVYQPSSMSQDTGRSFEISYATTNPDGSGSLSASGEIYQDVVSLDQANLSVNSQNLGAITDPQSPPTFPHDGLVGFAGEDESALQASPWIHSLCSQKSLAECRFGMALGTNGTGQMIYGSVDTSLFDGQLTTTPADSEWQVSGDVAVNGNVIKSNVQMVTDSGTTVIFAPLADAKAIFNAAGMSMVEHSGTNGNPTTLDGFYNCSSPPEFGFGFPPAGASSTRRRAARASSTIFNVLPEVLAQTDDDGNCTAIIHGTDEFQNTWLVGQAFFQGHYIDHNIDDGTMGFANLNDA